MQVSFSLRGGGRLSVPRLCVFCYFDADVFSFFRNMTGSLLLPRGLCPHDEHLALAHHRSRPRLRVDVPGSDEARRHAPVHAPPGVRRLPRRVPARGAVFPEEPGGAGDAGRPGLRVLALLLARLSGAHGRCSMPRGLFEQTAGRVLQL